MIDVEGGNNMMYLPLDQLINKSKSRVNDDDVDMTTSEGQYINNG